MFKQIEIPKTCPACDSDLIFEDPQLFCRNTNCSASRLKKLQHFVVTLKIKGLGPKTLEKLGLEEISELYALSIQDIKNRIGSEVLAQKLHKEIERSREASLETLLPAFSIPLVGKSVASKLCAVVESLKEINKETCSQAGLGPKVTDNILDWVAIFDPTELPFSFEIDRELTDPITESKGVVCITGKLFTHKTKSEAKSVLEANGYSVKDNVTRDVDILVNESGVDSAKVKKARSYGITIVTNINELIGE